MECRLINCLMNNKKFKKRNNRKYSILKIRDKMKEFNKITLIYSMRYIKFSIMNKIAVN